MPNLSVANQLLQALRQRGLSLFTGVPCSLLNGLHQAIVDEPEVDYIPAADEGDAVALACGAELGGRTGVVLMSNSGLGNAVNPLTSLAHPFGIPVLLLISWRGQPSKPDAVQHSLMGSITPPLLSLLELPSETLPSDLNLWPALLDRAADQLQNRKLPFALLVEKGLLCAPARSSAFAPRRRGHSSEQPLGPAQHTRSDYLCALRQRVSVASHLLVATTGYTGRELFASGDAANQFYMVGSMGCASSLGLGLAKTQPGRTVLVLDGDAALTMRMGSLAVVGQQAPDNFIHLVFDNGTNQSTGGQLSPSHGVDFCSLAMACGYRRAQQVTDPADLVGALSGGGPALLHIPVTPQLDPTCPRPDLRPQEVAARLRQLLNQ